MGCRLQFIWGGGGGLVYVFLSLFLEMLHSVLKMLALFSCLIFIPQREVTLGRLFPSRR